MIKQYTFRLDESLAASLDAYAKRLHINRTAAMNLILTNFFQGQKAMESLSDLMEAYKVESAKQALQMQAEKGLSDG